MSDPLKRCRTCSVKPEKFGNGLLTRPQVGQYHTGSPFPPPPPDAGLGEQVRKVEDTFSAMTVIMEHFFPGT